MNAPASTARVAIFGATSAIAHACARAWVQQGASVFLVGRNPGKLQACVDDLRVRAGDAQAQRVGSFQADLDDVDRHEAGLEAAHAFLGALDVVLVAQGHLPDQAECDRSVAATMQELHTNAVAVAALCLAAANRLESQGHGTLAVISSVAGDRGRQSNYTYGAAKGMLSLYLQGLRNRLYRKGIHVLTIKPGFVDSPMTAGMRKGPLWRRPEQIAQGILRAVERRRDVAYLPGFWRGIMAVITAIPEPLFKRLKL
jgi:hypothetical protein